MCMAPVLDDDDDARLEQLRRGLQQGLDMDVDVDSPAGLLNDEPQNPLRAACGTSTPSSMMDGAAPLTAAAAASFRKPTAVTVTAAVVPGVTAAAATTATTTTTTTATATTAPQRQYASEVGDRVWVIKDQASGQRICHAELLPRSHPESQRIAGAFAQYGKNVFETVQVWQVHHPQLEERYEKQRLAMALRACAAAADAEDDDDDNNNNNDDSSRKSGNGCLFGGLDLGAVEEKPHLYHTTKAPLAAVLAEGLDLGRARPGLFGRGLYATSSIVKASSYWPLHCNRRIMLEVSVLAGRAYEYMPGETCQGLTAPPQGCDSVSGDLHGHPETVVYNNSQLLIRYIVDYTVLPDYANVANTLLYGSMVSPSLSASSVTSFSMISSPSLSSVSSPWAQPSSTTVAVPVISGAVSPSSINTLYQQQQQCRHHLNRNCLNASRPERSKCGNARVRKAVAVNNAQKCSKTGSSVSTPIVII
eukprot:m.99996 g.99996  ORF g.99996 m.99996 type:complete len:476 (-) comp15608_c0_seq3:497-1924(-)